MTKKERVIKALNHQITDFVPYHIDFTQQARDNMVDYLDDKAFESKFGNHLHYIQYWGWPTQLPEQKDQYKDAFGVVWNRSGADKDIGVVDTPLIKDIEQNDYIFPVVDEKRLRNELSELIATKGDCFTFAGIGFSMFERSWSLMGMPEVLMAMLLSPEKLHNLYDQICEYNLKIINIILEYDIDGFYFGDDWGQQSGLIMGPDHWRTFIKPRMKRMYERVKSKSLYILQHSCGDIETIFTDLIEIGLDCYQTFQPEIYDIQKIKNIYGDRLSFWGGISTQQLLPSATPEVVLSETLRIMKIMSKNGGYICAPTHALTFDVPPENIVAMMDVLKNQA